MGTKVRPGSKIAPPGVNTEFTGRNKELTFLCFPARNKPTIDTQQEKSVKDVDNFNLWLIGRGKSCSLSQGD
ncbi:hypothetical protein ACUYOF_13210 [Photobacterium ganghwense]|uniref:hypothetical protein n=1 Tax=Photobacterium ganghwense TaxID=320778 RepID=UPI004057658C